MKLVWLVAWLGTALAQNLLVLRSSETIVQQIDAAQEQILLQVPALRGSPDLANALGRAVRVRGVRVYVLCQADSVRDGQGHLRPDSYLPWLAAHRLNGKYPNLELRLSHRPLTPLMVVDGRYVVMGDLLWQPPNPLAPQRTLAQDNPQEAARQTAWFSRRFAAVEVFRWEGP